MRHFASPVAPLDAARWFQSPTPSRVEHPESAAHARPLEAQFPGSHRLKSRRHALLGERQAPASGAEPPPVWRPHAERHEAHHVALMGRRLDAGRKQRR